MNKNEVIEGSLWQVTVYASFQRAKVYLEATNNDARQGVKKSLKKEIIKRLPKYKTAVTEEAHIKNIKAIARKIDQQWSSVLFQGSIPIGVVQKAFNLYLKLMWCSRKIKEPPHCPIDMVIIKKLPYKHRKAWTKIRDIQTYKDLIAQLKVLAKEANLSLARWELEVYKKE